WEETGDPGTVAQAVALCGWNAWPLPEWCVQPAVDALRVYAEKGQGRGRSAAPAKRSAARKADLFRHDLVEWLCEHGNNEGMTLGAACEEAAKILKDSNVTPRAIKASYYKVARTLK